MIFLNTVKLKCVEHSPSYLSNPFHILPHSLPANVFAGSEIELRNKILAYAEQVPLQGFWLDLVDAALCCKKMKKRLGIVVLVPGKDVEVRDIFHFLDSTMTLGKYDENLDIADSNTWLLMACRSDYRTSGVGLNHWIPLVHKDQVSPELWMKLTMEAKSNAMKKIRNIQAQMSNSLLRDTDMAVADSLAMERSKFLGKAVR